MTTLTRECVEKFNPQMVKELQVGLRRIKYDPQIINELGWPAVKAFEQFLGQATKKQEERI